MDDFLDAMKTVITKDEQRALLAYLEKIRKPKYTPHYKPDQPELYDKCYYCGKQAMQYIGRADAYFCWECGQWKERNNDD